MAQAIAARYGLPADDMIQRMGAGRFRVKAGIDRSTAERLADDLEALGALCVITDDSGQIVSRQGPASPAQPSGLAAVALGAVTGAGAAKSPVPQDLGALSSGSLTLATLDGEEDRPVVEDRLAAAYTPSDFAPPGVQQHDLQLAMDVKKPPAAPVAAPSPFPAAGPDELPRGGASHSDASFRRGAPRATLPSPAEAPAPPVAGPGALRAMAMPSAAPAAQGPASAAGPRSGQHRAMVPVPMAAGVPAPAGPIDRARTALADSARARFAVGVFAALLIGFLPAHILAVVREGSALGAIDEGVRAEQAQVSDIDEWNALDEFRASQLERKQSALTSIALSSLLLWAAAGGGLAFVWFRKIDWHLYRSPD